MVDNMPKARRLTIIVRPSLPNLLPGLLKAETAIGDPEARSRAIATLCQVLEEMKPIFLLSRVLITFSLQRCHIQESVWYHCQRDQFEELRWNLPPGTFGSTY